MASDWLDVQLQDVVSKLGDGLHGTPKYSEDGEYYFINGNNLENGKIVFKDTTKRVNKEQYLKYKKTLNDRTLLVSINGTIGNIAYYNSEKVVLGKSACYFNLKDDIDKSYVRYVLSGHYFQSYINTFATGTTIKNISLKTMREFSFKLPYLPEQKAIAHFLGTLDNKIELNRQMNQTLESMAQALFKSWFVDFDPVIDNALAAGNPIPDALKAKAEQRAEQLKAAAQRGEAPSAHRELFPAEFTYTEELGWIPKGWIAQPLDSVADYLNGLALQKFRPENSEDGFLPVVKIAQLKSGISNSEEKASKKINPEYIIDDGDVLFSWSGSLVVDIWCGGKAALNQHLFKVTSKKYPKWFYLYYTKHHLVEFQRIASDKAVTMGHIKREHLKQALCAVPVRVLKIKELLLFDDLLDSQIKNRVENQTLAKLRDILLPKLLSGELRVSEAAARVEGV